ncbi:hypothetical protein QR680_003358 [Steinernema hermaphroditum]|uniref:Uncharacterized protein n=1 Tax=Steinernema hermaphroditum TaxID=289476 RepID=A0AA39H6F1_9BILA|nr:hypothetical protein QR680_003358 [Steinernema hermaphroditum]
MLIYAVVGHELDTVVYLISSLIMSTLLRSGNAVAKLVVGFHATGVGAPAAAGVTKIKPLTDTVSKFATVDTLQKSMKLVTSQPRAAKGINVTSRFAQV